MIRVPFQAEIAGLILSAAIVVSTPMSAQVSENSNMTHTMVVAGGAQQSFPLQGEEGAYIRGKMHSFDHPIDLAVVDQAGQHVRQLLDDATGVKQFHFILGPAQHLIVSNASDESAELTLEFGRSIDVESMIGFEMPLLSPRLTALQKEIEAGANTDAFWDERIAQGTPMLEPSARKDHVIATFLWRRAQKNVRLWGGPTYDHTWLEQLGSSDVWYASFEMSTQARLSYAFSPDVPQFDGGTRENRVALLATLQADPWNKTPIYSAAPDKFSQKSMIEGPDAPLQPGLSGAAEEGNWAQAFLTSRTAPNRRVSYYTPAGFDPGAPDTVLLVLFDGPSYQTDRAPIPKILDNLIDQAQLPHVAVAFIDPVDGDQRGIDLTGNPEFADRLAFEWTPQIESQLGLRLPASRRVLAGSSYGGLATAYISHRHPEVFGNGIVMSGSFWWAPQGYDGQGLPYMSKLWIDNTPNVRMWLSAGLYEASRFPGTSSILETSRHLRDTLSLLGVDVKYREYAGGHDYLVWRGALAEGLLDLFGKG